MELSTMDRIVRQVEAWSLVCKHMGVLDQDAPLVDRHTVKGLAPVQNGEVEWARNVGVGVGETHPLTEGTEALEMHGALVVPLLAGQSGGNGDLMVLNTNIFQMNHVHYKAGGLWRIASHRCVAVGRR